MKDPDASQQALSELEDIQDEMEAQVCRLSFEERLKRGAVTIWELMQMYDELDNYRRKK